MKRSGVIGSTTLRRARVPADPKFASEAPQARASSHSAGSFVSQRRVHRTPRKRSLAQLLSRYPVLKIHQIAQRHAPRNKPVIARLTATLTSATSKKLQRKPLMR